MSVFCTKCGSPIRAHSKFCSKCGTPLRKTYTPSGDSANQAETTPETEKICPSTFCEEGATEEAGLKISKKKKKRGKAVLAAVIILLTSVLIVGGIILALGMFPSEDNGTSGKPSAGAEDTVAESSGESTHEPYESKPDEPAIPADEIERTIMIYIVGSDLESDSGAATMDIDEMLDAEFDTEKNHVLVYAGGAMEWQNDVISADENTVLLIEEDDIKVVKTFSAKNMADSDTLSQTADKVRQRSIFFAKWSKKRYNRDRKRQRRKSR